MEPFKQRSLRQAAKEGAKQVKPTAESRVGTPSPTDSPKVPARKIMEEPKAEKSVTTCEKCLKRIAHDKLMAERNAAAKERKKEKAKNRKGSPLPGRLPHGSHYGDIVYDGNKQEWTGTLYIPEGDNFRTFSAEASGVHWLLDKLCGLYVATLLKPENEEGGV